MPRYTEFQSCIGMVKWWAFYSRINKLPEHLLFHCPNQSMGGPRHGHNLKLMGVRAGTPDYMLAVARGPYHGMFLEIKSLDGRVSPEQKETMLNLTNQGYLVVLCRGAEEARLQIEAYLSK